jgi:hypothetical protein
MKINLNFHRPAGEVRRDVEAVGAVHVVRASQLDWIRTISKPDCGDGVNAVEDQIDPLTRSGRVESGRTGIKNRRITPVDPVHPPEGCLIPVQVWVGNDPACHQIGMDAAWHFGLIGPLHAS